MVLRNILIRVQFGAYKNIKIKDNRKKEEKVRKVIKMRVYTYHLNVR